MSTDPTKHEELETVTEIESTAGGAGQPKFHVITRYLKPGEKAPTNDAAYHKGPYTDIQYRTPGFPDMVNGFIDGD
jgi:hypothetical protein